MRLAVSLITVSNSLDFACDAALALLSTLSVEDGGLGLSVGASHSKLIPAPSHQLGTLLSKRHIHGLCSQHSPNAHQALLQDTRPDDSHQPLACRHPFVYAHDIPCKARSGLAPFRHYAEHRAAVRRRFMLVVSDPSGNLTSLDSMI